VNQLWQDLQFALRTPAKSPGFTVVAVLTLALGIGANVAIFSVVNTVMLKPLPFPDPDRIVMFTNVGPQGEGAFASATKFNAWRENTSIFQDVSAFRFGLVNLGGGSYPEQIHSGIATIDFFHLFGVSVARGRTFSAEEDRPGGGHVVVISDGMWKRQFGSDPQIIGKSISLGGEPYDVIGILGPSFDSRSFDPIPDVWLPFQIDPNSVDQGNYFVAAGRLKSGVTVGTAKAQLQLTTDEYRRKFPGLFDPKNTFGVKPMRDIIIGDIRPSLVILVCAVNFVLLIACANVANLLLIRATGRKREIAVRVAMGAGRARIIRQLLTESMLLSTAGGVLGMILGMVGIRALLAVNPGRISRIGQDGSLVTVDWRVVIFTIFISLISGILFGLIPALQASRADLSTALKEGSGRSSTGFRQNKARSILVVSEVTLALILLAGSALLIRTFATLRSVKPGFDSHNVLTMRMSLAGPRFQKTAALDQLIRDGVQRVKALPGVAVATATCCVPLEDSYNLPFIVVGRPPDASSARIGATWLLISSGYFDAFKIPVLRGRAFSDRDEAGAPPVVIINQTMARKFWANSDPLNDRIVIGKGVGPEFEGDPPRQIVGVVGDVHGYGLDRDPPPTMYIPEAQVLEGENALGLRIYPLAWVIRTSVDPRSLSTPIQDELRQASGGFPVGTIRTMDEVVARSTARQDFNMLLMSVFAGSALLLAAIGIYGLMSYSVQQRTQEIGIRMALGAESKSVRTMVVLQGMRLALIGVMIGIAIAFGLARFMGSFLFGVRPWDPAAFITVPIILCAVALIAAWVPALRASRVDPMVALRHE
jgi:predicted permease